MYAGAVAVPLIIGRALKLSPEDVAFLISADLFACGLATLVQSVGFPGVGIRLPVMMGVTFASVGPMLAMAAAPEVGLLGIYGSVIAAGIFGILVAPFICRLLPLFPPVVTGTIIMVIGISLMRVGINWAGGGLPTFTKLVDGQPVRFPTRITVRWMGWRIALFVLLVILGLIKWGKGFLANVAVLLGIIAGAMVASALGVMHFDKVVAAPWVDIVLPFHFGVPQFHLVPIVTMCIVMIVVMIESLGMFLALGEITGKNDRSATRCRGAARGWRRHAARGIFNTFPYTSFSQNVGLVGVTGVRSRWVTIAGGVIMLVLGLLPKMAALVEAVPLVVLGGAGLVMFGMVAATGARILTGVDFKTNRYNLFVVAISVGFGMIPLVAPNFFRKLPHELHPLLESGILLAAGRGDAERVLQWPRRQRHRRSGRRNRGGIGAACVRIQRSTPAIGRVVPGRDQQRHVETALGLADRKPHGDAVEKRRVRQRHAPRGKIIRGGEGQFVIADRRRPAVDQRLVGAAITVGNALRDDAVLAKGRQLDQLEFHSSSRRAPVSIQHMGGEMPVHLQPILRRHELVDAQRRDAEDFPERGLDFGGRVIGQAALEIAQHGILGVAADAHDVRETEFLAVGGVDLLERLVFAFRQPVEPGAVLFGGGFRP